MKWKNLPYWLKGGIIGLIYSICGVLALKLWSTWFYAAGYPFGMGVYIFGLIINIIFFPFGLLGDLSFFFYNQIFSTVFVVLVSAIIGWIVGKIKSKK